MTAFWVFMLIMDLLLPFTMIGFGKYFMTKGPKEINSAFGYRTSMSMKNHDTWEFAHKYCGKLWYIAGMSRLRDPAYSISRINYTYRNRAQKEF